MFSKDSYSEILERLQEMYDKKVPGILSPGEAALLLDIIHKQQMRIRHMEIATGAE